MLSNSRTSVDKKERSFIQFSLSSKLMERGVCVAIGIIVGILTIVPDNAMKTLLFFMGVCAVLLIFIKIEFGLVALVFITHSNLSTVLIENLGIPSIAKALTVLLIVAVFGQYAIQKTKPSGWQTITLLIGFYAFAALLSILFKHDISEGIIGLIAFAKDAVVAILIVLLVRRYADIRLVVWGMLASGTILATIAIVQFLTGNFESTYFGLSMAPSHQIVGEFDGVRLSGTFGDPNFFAMFQYILLPFALERAFSEKKVFLKWVAWYSFLAILFTVIYSYSRGALIGVFAMLAIFVYFYRQRIFQIISLTIVALLISFLLVNSKYVERMLTMTSFIPQTNVEQISERSFQGRKSEMLVAIKIFLDHPITGVGVGNYEQYYQEYSKELYLDLRMEDREAHCRYLEILSEMGAVGATVFFIILWQVYSKLLASRRFTAVNNDALGTNIVTAVLVSLTGFLTGYLFLHDAWPRMSWLMIGLCFAVHNIYKEKMDEEAD